ncbi:MAG: 2-oxo acid dehydrogenase subunit E2 [Candidatus Eisenbacteria bacterium]|nr:2-oxo acid dehydrogenase subunit E2 [Candidatus Eisenbacteria bacterium]
MPFEVKLPDIGEGVAEGEIVRWLVKPGDTVREDQPLVEVMTDKANVEIPSPRAGTIAALLVEEGKVVPVGTVLVAIAVAGDGATATPAVRQIARELGVALERVPGTGPGGRITSDDVRRAATGGPAPRGGAEQRIPLRGLRRTIAEAMRRSLDTAAHFTFVAECDMSAVAAHLRDARARRGEAAQGLTYLAYVIKALVDPLRAFPLLNARLDDAAQEIVLHRDLHVGFATATADGLTVPVVRDVDRRPLLSIAAEIKRLAAAARDGSIALADLKGATFTVTSTGARGGLLATPIIHHPQVAILGLHEVKKKPVVVDDAIVAREMTNLSLSLDHRVVDGAVGADFLYAVIARLAEPGPWLDAGDIT